MAHLIRYNLNWNADGVGNFSTSTTDTNNALVQISELQVSGPVTSREYDIVIPKDTLSTIIIYCSLDAVIKTNTSSPGDDTITLIGGTPVLGTQNAKVFTADVTKLFLSVAASDPFDFIVDCLLDSTP